MAAVAENGAAAAAAAATVQRLLEDALAAQEGVAAGAEAALLAGAKSEEGLARVQALLERTWERLNTGHWSSVPLALRRLYALTSLHKEEKLLSDSAASIAPRICVPTRSIPTLHVPSLQQFANDHFTPRLPVLLTGAANHWPARHRWCSLEYLCHVAGARTVPVELGAHYVDPNWAQRLMTLETFVRKHVESQSSASKDESSHSSQLGYLAQHPLFDQVPELRADICIPEYCCLSDLPDGPLDPDINAWFGPSGTVSPLHFDPKHNLLTQVVGSKRVLLYAPEQSSALYPHEGRLLNNTAQVDPENPDYEHFPDLRNAEAWECTLQPGDMLYIPPRWWHHVRSLSISFSVSFWWE